MSEPVRTPEQETWIRDRFKPDGLLRLARADRDYCDAHGNYLPDVAALAYIEWERAAALAAEVRQLREALAEIEDMSHEKTHAWQIARAALAAEAAR